MAQGKFNDFGWHSEWHTARKREYTEICIYMSDNRECQNRNSYYYLSKCFDSSHCKLKERKVVEPQTRKKKDIEKSVPQANEPKSYVQQKHEKTKLYTDVVTIQDSVVIGLEDSSQALELFYNAKVSFDEKPLHKLFLGKKVNDIVKFENRTYRVIKINKDKKSDSSLVELRQEKKSETQARIDAENRQKNIKKKQQKAKRKLAAQKMHIEQQRKKSKLKEKL